MPEPRHHLPARSDAQPLVDSPRNEDCSWYAIHVRSKFETAASASLEGKGYDVFLPSYRARRRWSDRVKELEQPLFPGYIFCRFDPGNRLPVLITPGVVGIVGMARIPEPIPDEEIRSVQRIMRSGAFAGPWPFLQVGQRVIIEKGCLAGTHGILLKFKNGHRIVVSISLLQRSIAAELDVDNVRALRSSPVNRGLATATGGI